MVLTAPFRLIWKGLIALANLTFLKDFIAEDPEDTVSGRDPDRPESHSRQVDELTRLFHGESTVMVANCIRY